MSDKHHGPDYTKDTGMDLADSKDVMTLSTQVFQGRPKRSGVIGLPVVPLDFRQISTPGPTSRYILSPYTSQRCITHDTRPRGTTSARLVPCDIHFKASNRKNITCFSLKSIVDPSS